MNKIKNLWLVVVTMLTGAWLAVRRTRTSQSPPAKHLRDSIGEAKAGLLEWVWQQEQQQMAAQGPAQTLFEIRRRHLGDPMSRLFPAGYVSLGTGLTIYARGTAVGAAGGGLSSVQDIQSGVPASGKNFLGFVTRDVVDGGPTLFEIDIPTNPLALPFTAGLECALEKAEEVECEGTGYICTSGTGAITSGTALGTVLSFDGSGRFYVAQSGDNGYYELTGNSGLAGNGPVPSVAGNLRILAESLKG